MKDRFKVGQSVKSSLGGWRDTVLTVLHVHEDGLEVSAVRDGYLVGDVRFFTWAQLITPEVPKAKPGVPYMDKGHYFWIGRDNGRLARTSNVATTASDKDFDPDQFTEVTPR